MECTPTRAAGERLTVVKRLLVCLCGFVALSSTAFADGSGPTRKMTPVESAEYNRVRETILGALPKVPAGYDMQFAFDSEDEEGLLPEGIKPGQMCPARYTARYILKQDVIDQQALSMQLNRTKGTPEQQKRLAELDAKDAELTKARDATRDRAEKERIRAELKEVRAQGDKVRDEIVAGIQAWVAAGGGAQTAQDLNASLPAKELTIRILVNQDAHLPDQTPPYGIEGVPLAFEQADSLAVLDTHCITLFLGPFEKVKKVSGYTGYNLPEASLGVPTKARGIVLVFSGPKDRPDAVRDFVRQTDLAKIKALLP